MRHEHHSQTDDDRSPPESPPQAPRGFSLARPRLNVVLVEPEIPNNTGNIGRTCVTTGCRLHLVRPLAFDIDEKACRRAGLDYWPRLDLREHDSLEAYLGAHPPRADDGEPGRAGRAPRTWFLTTRATRTIYDAPIAMGDHLVFGRESAGLPQGLLDRYPAGHLCVPLMVGERSLNLSTCVAVCVYESVRKMIGSGDVAINAQGRLVEPDR